MRNTVERSGQVTAEQAGANGGRAEEPEVIAPGPVTRRSLVKSAALAGLAAVGGVSLTPAQAEQEATVKFGGGRRALRGQTAVVTGAARGIGRAIAVTLAGEGANVVGVDIVRQIPTVPYPLATPEDLAETGRLVRAQGRRFLGVEGDVRDMEQMRHAAGRAVSQFGRIDILAANAGIINYGVPLATITDEQLRDVIDVNLIGAANSMRAVLPHMIERRAGRIVAVSSGQGRIGAPGLPNYAASKWGLIGLVKSVALEVGASTVTVNAVVPGVVNTTLSMNEASYRFSSPQNPTREGFAQGLLMQTALPVPWVEPEDVANGVLYLVSPESRYITGEAFDVALGLNARYTA